MTLKLTLKVVSVSFLSGSYVQSILRTTLTRPNPPSLGRVSKIFHTYEESQAFLLVPRPLACGVMLVACGLGQILAVLLSLKAAFISVMLYFASHINLRWIASNKHSNLKQLFLAFSCTGTLDAILTNISSLIRNI